MPGRHMNLLIIEQQAEIAPMNNDQLVIVLNSGSACTARRVQNVSDYSGATPHPQIFPPDIQQPLRFWSRRHTPCPM